VTFFKSLVVIVNFFKFLFKSVDIMDAIIYSYTYVIAAMVIVIISKGIPSKPMIPRIRKAAIKFGTTPIKDKVMFLNKIKNIKVIPVITTPKVNI